MNMPTDTPPSDPHAQAQAQARLLGLPFVDLRQFAVPPEMAGLLAERHAQRLRAIVLEDLGHELRVGLADPMDVRVQDELYALLRRPLDFVVITPTQWHRALDRLYRRPEQLGEFAREVEREVNDHEGVIDLLAVERSPDEADAPVVKLLQTVFEEAGRVNASDIHIEPQEATLTVRFRIDGQLHVQIQADPRIAPPLMVRLKLMANLDIAERRLPQEGRISVRTSNARYDVRLSTVPTQFGESVVLRLLRVDASRLQLDKLMPPPILEAFEGAIQQHNGIVLVTGPTGSGKTTTLYAALDRLNQPHVKILTAEDPVEYRMPGICQVHINERIGLTFAKVLRSFLRQDPEIIFLGEVRDAETAEIAVRAAMTGHLVLSTLHTNDAPSTPLRLMDMGIPAYMIASTLRAVLSQRLVRVNCKACAVPVRPDARQVALLGRFLPPEAIRDGDFRQGTGCAQCNRIGYAGRAGVYEALVMTPALCDTLARGEPGSFERAVRGQMQGRTMAHHVLQLVTSGRTTLEEAMTVIAGSPAATAC
ncbi:MAG: Flp pilus assembly complex ATPase component TadA [Pseudomonadota bacterium]